MRLIDQTRAPSPQKTTIGNGEKERSDDSKHYQFIACTP
jgi:hypothetical protein